jgi:hypothetical protein
MDVVRAGKLEVSKCPSLFIYFGCFYVEFNNSPPPISGTLLADMTGPKPLRAH